ncbi:DDHD domain-containing protein [Xylariaceae sp. FL0255]|nr:DDHD domain-containing protein [Xylariaceae sp. FL0255]
MSSIASHHPFSEQPKQHNLGSKCRLAPVQNPFPTEPTVETAPRLAAHYFYSSLIPIDDPLSVSALVASADSRSSRAAFQPFSPGDNNAIERAWLDLADDRYRRNHSYARRRRSPSPASASSTADTLATIIHNIAVKHAEKHAREGPSLKNEPEGSEALCCPDLQADVGLALRGSFCAVARRRQHSLDREAVAEAVIDELKTLRTNSFAKATEQRGRSGTTDSSHLRGTDLELQTATRDNSISKARTQPRPISQSLEEQPSGVIMPTQLSYQDAGITGKPFVRVGAPEDTIYSPPPSLPRATSIPTSPKPPAENKDPALPEPAREVETVETKHTVNVPVGVSKLHEVTLPALQMKPIYWSPVNDLATVMRATWFYRDDMRPIDPSVANQLEAGYQELRPYSETWRDELRCAIDVGPLGEEKVSHPLWPKAQDLSRKKKIDFLEPVISSDPFCAARCFRGEASAEGSLLPVANEDTSSSLETQRKFEQYHVVYKDEKNAFLLKPSLKPSAYYGRRPIAKICRGLTIGVPVVRGFDYDIWMRKHQKKQTQQQIISQIPASPEDTRRRNRDDACPACQAERDRSQVTDLVLVVHGIGQKLAERIENYHFTHAINAFRRAINIELGNDAVKAVLRDGQNGIMVLPVNWRQNLSFEEGGPMKEEDKAHYAVEGFGLKDIEPRTIPAVRGMISDVMFDIPFYMSHHKPQMVAALVSEANRVYRLWCRNNPRFSENGRVHLIGHSLGSVMSIEVLSQQPTTMPTLQLAKELQTRYFEFDTKNLFLLGSPAAFFLLLERGALLPRRGRRKPGADPADVVSSDVVGDAGSFGCLAVDNIYNILAREDPVAYLLNGTVDPMYAASLKTAYVPSASPTIFQSMGNAVRGLVPGVSATSVGNNPSVVPPKPPTMRLPSQLELEVHDFTREEIAEKKAFLLNDNGQVDYFLQSGGGPLELQYLNMLSAHSSYWVNHDLIRLLCQEIGRKPGKENTLPTMRAMKAAKRRL